MTCRICKKSIGGQSVSTSGNGWQTVTIPYHTGKNGKACTGSGQPPK